MRGTRASGLPDRVKVLLRRAGLADLVDKTHPDAGATRDLIALCTWVNSNGGTPEGVFYSKNGRNRFVYAQQWGRYMRAMSEKPDASRTHQPRMWAGESVQGAAAMCSDVRCGQSGGSVGACHRPCCHIGEMRTGMGRQQ